MTPGNLKMATSPVANPDASGVGSNDLRAEVARLFAEDCGAGGSPGLGERTLSPDVWKLLKDFLVQEVARLKNVRADSMARRIRELARVVGLSTTDISILELLLRYKTQPLVSSLVDDMLKTMPHRSYRLSLANRVLPDLLGLSYNTSSARLSPNKPLVRTGMVFVDDDGEVNAVDRLQRLAFVAADSTRNVGQLLFGAAPPGELYWSDFEHVAEGRDHVERLIRGALKANATGVNVLIYGPPGTGKTEFCRTLAARLGVTLHSVGESDDDGNEPNRAERLQELVLVQHVFGGSHDTLLLFDEMEDLLADSIHMNMPNRMPVDRTSARQPGIQGVHEQDAGTEHGTDAVDFEFRRLDLPDGTEAHDVRLGTAPTFPKGAGTHLGTATRTPRHRVG